MATIGQSDNKLSNFGGASRDRTDDPLLAKQMLSQLSYGPISDSPFGIFRVRMVGLDGLEPSTPRLSSVCSNQLSYRPVQNSELRNLLNSSSLYTFLNSEKKQFM